MGAAHAMVEQLVPDLEMHGDAALSEAIRSRLFQGCRLMGKANLLIMPNLDTANTAFNLLKAGECAKPWEMPKRHEALL